MEAHDKFMKATHDYCDSRMQGSGFGHWWNHHAWARNLAESAGLGLAGILTGGFADLAYAGGAAAAEGISGALASADTAADAAATGARISDVSETAADSAGAGGRTTTQAERELAAREKPKTRWEKLPNRGKYTKQLGTFGVQGALMSAPISVLQGAKDDIQQEEGDALQAKQQDDVMYNTAQSMSQAGVQSDVMQAQNTGRHAMSSYLQ